MNFKVGSYVSPVSLEDNMITGIVCGVSESYDVISVIPISMRNDVWEASDIFVARQYSEDELVIIYNNIPSVDITVKYVKCLNLNDTCYAMATDMRKGVRGIAECLSTDVEGRTAGAKLALSRLAKNMSDEEQSKPKFKPHLTTIKYNGLLAGMYDDMNILGTQTNITDVIGRPIRIGDTVLLYAPDKECTGEHVIRCSNSVPYPFVQGIALMCNEDGTIKNGWKIILNRKYEDIPDGTVINDFIKYVKESSSDSDEK